MGDRWSRRRLLGTGVGALAATSMLRAAPRRPNVLIILTDDQGWSDVSFNGCRDYETPNLDALRQGGVFCRRAHCSHPFCSPMRAGLMTGRYQQRFGHENNPTYDPALVDVGLPLGETPLPRLLSEAGYVTGHIGKWHLGAAPHFHPLRRGFDEHFGFIGGGHDYFQSKMELPAPEYRVPIEHNGEPVPMRGYLTDMLSDAAAEFISRHRQRPWFCYLAYNAPHTPLAAPPERLARFAGIADEKRRPFAAMMSAVDDGVGQVLATLRRHELERDTLVFYLSDNGGQIQHGATNGPLRAGKGAVYEGGTRTPLTVRWPARLPANATYHEPVMSLDILPTALAAAGVTAAPPKPLDGADLVPYLAGDHAGRPHEFVHQRVGGGAAWAVTEGSLKLLKRQRNPAELYDVEADVGEQHDLAAARPAEVARLNEVHEAWNRELIAPLFQSPR